MKRTLKLLAVAAVAGIIFVQLFPVVTWLLIVCGVCAGVVYFRFKPNRK